MAGCHQKERGFWMCGLTPVSPVTSNEIQEGLIPGPVPSIPGGISCNTGYNQRVDLPAAWQSTASQDQQQLQAPTTPETRVYSNTLFWAPYFENTSILLSLCTREARVYCSSNQVSVKHPGALPHDSPCALRDGCTLGARSHRGEGMAFRTLGLPPGLR